MRWLKDLFNSESSTNEQYTFRQDKLIPTDDVFRAWTSGDLDKMLKAANIKTNLLDRHHLLQSIVAETYKLRKDEKYRSLCIDFSEKHLEEFPSILIALKEDLPDMLPRVTTFQNYATILTEDGEFEKAIEVCKKAISYGLNDGTQSGYEGRIERIKKKIDTVKK